ncbi:MAG: DUF99 family protein [Candidatus Bipolaricaulia bacterium]
MAGLVLSNAIGFDDAPFRKNQAHPVPLVGAVFAGQRLDGVVVDEIARDGADVTDAIVRSVSGGKFAEHVRLVMLQGATFAGFNVVDAHRLHATLNVPVLIVARHPPDFDAIRDALMTHIPDGERKWRLIEALGPMELLRTLYVQRVGLSFEQADATLRQCCIHSQVPEPLRVAHLVAGALVRGESRGPP